MEREKLLEYLKELHTDNSKQVEEFEKVLLENIDTYYFEKKDDEILLLFKDCVRVYGGILSELNQLQKATPLYNKMQIVISDLCNRGKVGYSEKNSFDVMQVKCLAETGKRRKAINRVSGAFHEFMRRKNEIVNELQGEKGAKARALVDSLLSLKSLCRFAKALCNQIGLTEEAAEFYYRERTLERFVLGRGAIDDRIDHDLRNEHKAQFPDSAPMTIYIGNSLDEVKGWWKRIKFRLSVFGKFIFNWVSFILWGYGERIWQIVAIMCGLIIVFAIIFFKFNLINVNDISFWNYLYFSIVTFTTLGYGDLYPMDCVAARLTASIEAFLGVCFIALFIFALGKRATR